MSEPLMSPGGASLPQDAKTWAMVCHVAGLAAFIGIPFANLIGPLVVWLLKKDTHPFVDRNGREALNFQIAFTVYGIAAILLTFVLIGFLLLPVVGIAWLVLLIMAAVKTSNGEDYRYPFIFRVL